MGVRVSQLALEVLEQNAGLSRARVSQVAVEVARSAADHITFVRASQLTLEVLLPYRVARFTVQIV